MRYISPPGEETVQGMMATLGVIDVRMTVPTFVSLDPPGLSYQLMAIGGGLLIAAAVLMGLEQRSRVARETRALMLYLGRIAKALERLQQVGNEQAKAAEVMRRLEELAHGRETGKVREMPKYRSR